jgi:hypothetical protein
MVNNKIPSFEQATVSFSVSFLEVDDYNVRDFSVREVTLSESLLTPGLQTSILVDSFMHVSPDSQGKPGPPKNFDRFKNQLMQIQVERPLLEGFNMPSSLQVSQRIYRLDSRKPTHNNNNEQFRVHACDDSLLNDARTLVSDMWTCTTPSQIVREVLQSCVGVSGSKLQIEQSGPARDYVAENIHPFQVVTQQANAALANNGNDPSFVHYMTYENFGTHHFKSIYNLSRQQPVFGTPFVFSETGASSGYNNPYSILNYSFPCDFDLLSDILNGVDVDGSDINSAISMNILAGTFSLFGNQAVGCGTGGGVMNLIKSNYNTERSQDMCRSEIEKYRLKRQARMSLLEQDKIALKLTVPWNPAMNVGKLIKVEFKRKGVETEDSSQGRLYGSGTYLIVNLVHSIKSGGFSTTTMECVAQTAGQGIV